MQKRPLQGMHRQVRAPAGGPIERLPPECHQRSAPRVVRARPAMCVVVVVAQWRECAAPTWPRRVEMQTRLEINASDQDVYVDLVATLVLECHAAEPAWMQSRKTKHRQVIKQLIQHRWRRHVTRCPSDHTALVSLPEVQWRGDSHEQFLVAAKPRHLAHQSVRTSAGLAVFDRRARRAVRGDECDQHANDSVRASASSDRSKCST